MNLSTQVHHKEFMTLQSFLFNITLSRIIKKLGRGSIFLCYKLNYNKNPRMEVLNYRISNLLTLNLKIKFLTLELE